MSIYVFHRITLCLFVLCTIWASSLYAEEFYPEVYSFVKSHNGKTIIHDPAHNRYIELRNTTLFSGGNSQLRITNSPLESQGKVFSLPVIAKTITPINASRLLVFHAGLKPGIILIDTNGIVLDSYSLAFGTTLDTLYSHIIEDKYAFLIYGTTLYHVFENKDSIITHKIQDNVFATTKTHDGLLCVIKNAGGLVLRKILRNGSIAFDIPFTSIGSSYRIVAEGNSILVLASSSGESSAGFIYSQKTGTQTMVFFPCSPSLCELWEENGVPILSWIVEDEQGLYSLATKKLGGKESLLLFPYYCTSPSALIITDNEIHTLFSNALCTSDKSLSPSFKAASPISALKMFSGGTPSVFQFDNSFIVTNAQNYIIIQSVQDNLWWMRRFAKQSGIYLIAIALIILITVFYRRYARQKRFLEAGLELSGMGIIMYLDAEGRVRKMNATAKTLLGVSMDVPMKRPVRYYVLQEQLGELLSFIEESMELRQPVQRKIRIEDKEYICSATPLFGFAGNFAGSILSGLDITEELEKKRLTNWAQLAHDMQTTLSIILLNAQQLHIIDDVNKERQRKILAQINLLMQRVRDIVTVGRDEETHFSLHDAAVICHNVIDEFDSELFPNAKLIAKGKNVLFSCDPVKLTRGLRNAVENGIRALQKHEGSVELSCTFDEKMVYFRIKDSGIGMDDFTKINMMKPYFTTKNSQGGYGIGTMVMQKVAEQHNGRIEVISEPNQGTVITFIIPREQS